MPLRKVVGSPLSITQFRIAPARSQGSSSSRRRSSVGDGQIIGSLSSDLKVTVAGRLVPMGEASTMPRGRVAVKVRPTGVFATLLDRTSVVWGKSVSVRVNLVGGGIIQKN